MADDPAKRGPQDRSRVNVNEAWELNYWSEKFGVPAERLMDAVRQVGTRVEDVERHLTARAR